MPDTILSVVSNMQGGHRRAASHPRECYPPLTAAVLATAA